MIHLAVCSIIVSLPALNAPATRPAAADRQTAARPALTAAVDRRVELMSVIFRWRATRSTTCPSPDRHTRRPSGSCRELPRPSSSTKARQLRSSRGVGFDAVMDMAVHIEDAVSLSKERVPFDNPACKLD